MRKEPPRCDPVIFDVVLTQNVDAYAAQFWHGDELDLGTVELDCLSAE
ncbi:hypothetical protein [Mycobacterium sp. 141]|nr:hypothetical protein [Mycobacterium sp. 141]